MIVMLLLVQACSSTPDKTDQQSQSQPVKAAVKQVAQKTLSLNQQLWQAARENPDSEAMKSLVARGAELNAQNPEGYTALHLIAAARDQATLQWALDKGADPSISNQYGETPYDFLRNLVMSRAAQATLSTQKDPLNKRVVALTLAAAADPTASNRSSSNAADRQQANEEINKLTLLKAHAWRHQLTTQQQPKWQQQKQQMEQAQQAKRRQLEQRKAALAKPIDLIPEPTLPPVSKHKKSPFETLAMFKERMQTARQQRQQQTEAIFARYREAVEARNAKVKQQSLAKKQLAQDIRQSNRDTQQQQQIFRNDQLRFYARLDQRAKALQPGWYSESLALVYGQPSVWSIEVDGQPKYLPEQGKMFAQLRFAGLQDTQEVVMSVPPGQAAENLYNQLKQGQLPVRVDYRFEQSEVLFKQVSIQSQSKQAYVARLNAKDSFQLTAPVEVVIQVQSTGSRA